MIFDQTRGQVLLFGGSDGAQFLNDTWVYDGLTWTQRATATSPPVRQAHVLMSDALSGRVVLFGGLNSSGLLGDTWTFDGVDWTQHTQTSPTPSPRFSAGAAWLPAAGVGFLFGGQRSSSPLFLGDLWRWNGTDWSLAATTTPVGPRSQTGFAYHPGRGAIVLAGGHTNVPRDFLSDTWTFDGTTWTLLGGSSFAPSRSQSAMAYVGTTGRMMLFGGYAGVGLGTRFGDTWELTATGWQQTVSPRSPTARHRNAATFDPARGNVVLFGGSTIGNTGNQGDTWTFGDAVVPIADSLGSGCSWGGATPLLQALSLPWSGESLELTMTGLPPAPSVPFLVIGSRATPPVDLGFLGAAGCLAFLNPLLPLAPTAGVNLNGTAMWTIQVPTGLGGTRFHLQGLVVAPTANALGAVVSNAIVGVVE